MLIYKTYIVRVVTWLKLNTSNEAGFEINASWKVCVCVVEDFHLRCGCKKPTEDMLGFPFE